MNFIKDMFSESSDVSCMRVMAFLSLLIGAGLSFYTVTKGTLPGAIPVIAIFVGAAFGGKIGQKYLEGTSV